jgi:hypothetical protein
MFLLARQWLDRRDATFAAVLYAVNPYHLVIVYWRSAFAELLASSLLPLLLLLSIADGEKRPACNRLSGYHSCGLMADQRACGGDGSLFPSFADCGDRLAAALAPSRAGGVGCGCSRRGTGRILFVSRGL